MNVSRPNKQHAEAPDGCTTSQRVLDPIDRISEVLFGLIIVLTFTCSLGFRRVSQEEVHTMLLEVIGCSLAWGVIDAVFYLLGCLSDRGHRLLLLRELQLTSNPAKAREIIAEVLPPLIASKVSAEEYDSIHMRLKQLTGLPPRPPLEREDLAGAFAVFMLAFLSIFPVVIPFIFVSDPQIALRVSNCIAIVLLFVAGYALGRYASAHPWRIGVVMVALGTALVGVAVGLGG